MANEMARGEEASGLARHVCRLTACQGCVRICLVGSARLLAKETVDGNSFSKLGQA